MWAQFDTVPYATDLGLSAIAAAAVLTIIGILGTVGRIGLGFAGDKFSNRTTIFTGFALLAVAYCGMLLSATTATSYSFAVIYGCISGFGILLTPLVAEYFGMVSLGAITGFVICLNAIGGAIGPTLAGYIFDSTGSYRIAFLICTILAIIGAALFWRLKPTIK